MSTLTAPEGKVLQAYANANNGTKAVLADLFGTEVFNRKITDRVKTYEDACAVLGIDPAAVVLSIDTTDEAAYKKLKVIARALNEGWTPDWNDDDQAKYWPWLEWNGSGFSFDICVCNYQYSNLGSRLCFRSSQLAEYAARQFESIYNDFFKL